MRKAMVVTKKTVMRKTMVDHENGDDKDHDDDDNDDDKDNGDDVHDCPPGSSCSTKRKNKVGEELLRKTR